jgi:hypothetical protein
MSLGATRIKEQNVKTSSESSNDKGDPETMKGIR